MTGRRPDNESTLIKLYQYTEVPGSRIHDASFTQEGVALSPDRKELDLGIILKLKERFIRFNNKK